MNNLEQKPQSCQTDVIASAFSFFVGGTEIILENKGENQGQITINDKELGAYQMYWGAMGGTIQDFLMRINSDYFTDKLLGVRSTQVFDVKRTFAALRKYIRTEVGLPWYKHQEFQSNLRENLNLYQERCEEYNSEKYFVDHFTDYLCRYPSFYLIDDRFEQERIEGELHNISEPWNFICTKESQEAKWLKSLHCKIKRKLELPSESESKKCCRPVAGFYLGMTCPTCNKPFRSVLDKRTVSRKTTI